MKRLFWDAEFSPNVTFSWRVGRKIHLSHENIIVERQVISIAWKWQEQKTVHSLSWDKNQQDKSMLQEFNEVLNSCDEAVAHFGDGYDWPMFRARCIIQGIRTNPYLKTVDTCKLAGRLGFNSKSLDYLAKVLQVGEKLDTGFSLWKKVVLDNDAAALRKMLAYNRHDVFPLLEGVYHKLEAISPSKSHLGVMNGEAKWSCPTCASTEAKLSKVRVTARGAKSYQMQCQPNGHYYTISGKVHEDYKNR